MTFHRIWGIVPTYPIKPSTGDKSSEFLNKEKECKECKKVKAIYKVGLCEDCFIKLFESR